MAMMATKIAFSPQSSWVDSDPGSGRSVTLAFSYLRPEELIELGELWSTWHGSIPSITGTGWRPILELLTEWVYPDPKLLTSGREDTEVSEARRRVASQMLLDVAVMAAERPGVQQKLVGYAREIGTTIPNRLDPEFEVLFPGREHYRRDWQAAEEKQLAAATRLAEEWANREPSWVARQVADLRREAALVQNRYPDYSDTVCRLIAEKRGRQSGD